MVAPMMAVFAFQFAGREYHPPVGDHTCLGYLIWGERDEHQLRAGEQEARSAEEGAGH